MKKRNILKWVMLALTIVVNVFIIVNGFIDGNTSAKESGVVSQIVEDGINTISPNTITDSNRPQFKLFTRKLLGHFCLCGLSGILTTITIFLFLEDTKFNFHVWIIAFSLGFGFVISMISELAQLTAPGRVFSMKDVGIDFCGYFLGFLVVFIVLIIIRSAVFKYTQEKEAE